MQESGENYLECILILAQTKQHVRAIDIANRLSFSKPSIPRAMAILKDAGHITVSKEGYIRLTRSGTEIAERIYERHQLLTSLFISLGVSEKTAAADACRVEHVISEETFSCLKQKWNAKEKAHS